MTNKFDLKPKEAALIFSEDGTIAIVVPDGEKSLNTSSAITAATLAKKIINDDNFLKTLND